MIIIKNPEACTGCLICKLACSFHHTREFSRSHSSIRVLKSIFNSEKGAKISITFQNDDERPTCDLCEGERFPLCVSLCPEKVLKVTKGD